MHVEADVRHLDSVPERLRSMPTSLATLRMVANLFDNELKHLSADCEVAIWIREEESALLLGIEDNGPGFGAEIQPHLFERRVRGKGSSGHGLGLAFVEAVARAHGGTVTASNRNEGGARIVVAIPLPRQKGGYSNAVASTASN